MKAFATKHSTNNTFTRTRFKVHSNPITKVRSPSPFSISNTALQRKPNCPCGGRCSRCKDNHHIIQPKLKINEPGDKHEREADRVADQVMRMPDDEVIGISHVNTNIQRKCAECTSGEDLCPECDDEEEGLVQRKLHNDNEVSDSAVHDSFLYNLGPGQPLAPSTRAYFEPCMGRDFSHVRVHTGSKAAESARSVNALAYTFGNSVVFSKGDYQPETEAGKRLLAHELAHVAQQSHEGASIQCAPAKGKSPAPPEPEIINVDVRNPECRYERGEGTRSLTPKGFLDLDVAFANFYGIDKADTVVIGDFGVNDGELKYSTLAELRTNYWIDTFENRSTGPLEIIGYSDCVGWENHNKSLREKRAQAVARLLPKSKPRIKLVDAAPFDVFLTDNKSARGRALNRSVIIQVPQQAPTLTPKPPTPTPAPEYVMITLHEPDTEDCDKNQRFRLAVAFPLAKIMVEHALSVISNMDRGSEEEALLIKYFGKDAFSHRWHIMRGFVDTLRAWSSDPTFQCVAQGAGHCKPTTNAYYYEVHKLTGGNIRICAKAFGRDDEGLAETVLHEASHLFDWTDDEQYCSLQTGCSLDITDAEDNADSYSTFAQEAFHRWY